MAFVLPEQNLKAPERKTYGAKPIVVTDMSQIPTVKISEESVKVEQQKNPSISQLSQETPKTQESQIEGADRYRMSKEVGSPTIEETKIEDNHFDRTLNIGRASKMGGEKSKKINLDSIMRVKVSLDCIRMHMVISEVSKQSGSEWVRIGREVFESMGVNKDRIIDRRHEGVESGLFDFKEIKKISKKTGKEYTDHVIYKTLK